MFTKKALLGSLSFSMFFVVGNLSGVIAQNIQKSERYLSGREIQSFEPEIQAELRSGSRFYLDRRTSLETNQINDFVNAWQKVDPSIIPYLGSWTGWESGVDIYPSSTKGQVCIVSTGIGINQYIVDVGRVSNNKLLLEGEGGKGVIIMKRGVLRSGNTIDFIVGFGSYNGRNGHSSYVFPRIPREINDNRITRLGCTTSFPSPISRQDSSYSSIPSVPPSSTSVKLTDTIAKYPTNDNFKKVDRILQASSNPESSVNLKGNQQDQRRKFQKEWEGRNPAAAKFLGGWYTGNKFFYVYPSTVKGGTCVVTQDANSKLDMKIGVVLNKELRYGGGKGFFWIDRANIVASRDSGAGDLYPIYATSEVPKLSESMIGDMERQKCITTLP